MFKKLLDEMLEAQTEKEIVHILYRQDGVDMSFQHDRINWKDHERLFKLADRLINGGVRK